MPPACYRWLCLPHTEPRSTVQSATVMSHLTGNQSPRLVPQGLDQSCSLFQNPDQDHSSFQLYLCLSNMELLEQPHAALVLSLHYSVLLYVYIWEILNSTYSCWVLSPLHPPNARVKIDPWDLSSYG